MNRLSESLYEHAGRIISDLAEHSPSQADLRRATSAAYYAVFHGIIEEAVSVLFSGAHPRKIAARSFEHGSMRDACNEWRKQGLADKQNKWGRLAAGAPSQDVLELARLFVIL